MKGNIDLYHFDSQVIIEIMSLKPLLYCNTSTSLPNASASQPNGSARNPNASRWNIGCVGSLRLGLALVMLFVSISVALGRQWEHSFQWNMVDDWVRTSKFITTGCSLNAAALNS